VVLTTVIKVTHCTIKYTEIVKAYDIDGWQDMLFLRLTQICYTDQICPVSMYHSHRFITINIQLSQTTIFAFFCWSDSEWGYSWIASGPVWAGLEKGKSLSLSGVWTQSSILHKQNLDTCFHYNKSHLNSHTNIL
jgi:hypothetical protein